MFLPTRRKFLQQTAAALALLASGSATRLFNVPSAEAALLNNHLREYIMLCDTDMDVPQTNHLRVSHPGSVKGYDVAAGETFTINLPFFGHKVDQHPVHPEQVVTFEKWGKRGALLDLRQREVLTYIDPADDNTFFGHAAFNADGSVMATTENNYDATQGLITYRSTADMKVVQKVESHGLLPHECRTPDFGKTIMVINKGDGPVAPNLTWMDWNSGALINRIEFPRDNNVLYGHCDQSFDHWVCISGLTKETVFKDMVLLISPDGKVFPPELPKDIVAKMKGEALSIAFLGQSGLVAVTVTLADLVLLIDYKTQKLVEVVNIIHPNGVLPSAEENVTPLTMLVSSYANRNLNSVVLATGALPQVTLISSEFGGLGSHLSRMYW